MKDGYHVNCTVSSNVLLDKGRVAEICKKSVFVILLYLLLPYGGTISIIPRMFRNVANDSLCGKWEGWARNQVNHTSWVAVVTPNDRPKSVPNRCLIELFCGAVCVVILPSWHFCWCMGFCHRTESDLFLFSLCLVLGQSLRHACIIILYKNT